MPSVQLAVKEGRNGLWGKTREAFRYVWDRYQDQVDWFLKADDDTYVIPLLCPFKVDIKRFFLYMGLYSYAVLENLRYFLSPYNTSKPLWFGHKYKTDVKAGYFSGGAGI